MHAGSIARLILFGLIALSAAWAARADVVTDWDAIAATTITPPAGTVLPAPVTEAEQRPIYQVDLATLHVAIYDAVSAIDRKYKPYAIVPRTRAWGASQEAAVVGAAYGVLSGLYPGRSLLYQSAYDNYAAGAVGDAAKTLGLALGAEVATGILALRAHDGRLTPVSYLSTGAPGDFEPGPTPLLNAYLPYVKPFAIRSASQFRAPGPPRLNSLRYARDFNEVQALGSSASVLRTAEQTDIARFYTESSATYFPRNFRRFASDAQSIADNARLLAMIWVVNADAQLGCFESKYHYRFWRPRTAVPRAAEDGNPLTVADSGWAPLVATPNHPEYPSAHSCNDGSLAETLLQFYGTKNIAFIMDSKVTGLLQSVRSYSSTDAMEAEVADARVFGGIHFRTATTDGASLGHRTAEWISDRFFTRRDD